MIGRLRGVIAEQGLDGSCVVDVNGVGYEVFVPLGSLGRLPQDPEPVTLHVHTHVREDALILYGFPTAEERATFRVILSVSGVGPKIALAILSSLSPAQLAQAVSRADRTVFKGIPGVGKKTAERLLLELKDKLSQAVGAAVTANARRAAPLPAPAVAAGPLGTVASALVNMGYKPAEAETAVSHLAEVDGKPVEELLREALLQLG